jgi:hypothetical protein
MWPPLPGNFHRESQEVNSVMYVRVLCEVLQNNPVKLLVQQFAFRTMNSMKIYFVNANFAKRSAFFAKFRETACVYSQSDTHILKILRMLLVGEETFLRTSHTTIQHSRYLINHYWLYRSAGSVRGEVDKGKAWRK